MTRQEYILEYTPFVLYSTVGTGLFPSVMMAQAILESSDKNGVPGNSTLARIYNNHFGIKADKSWLGRKVNLKTREVLNGKTVVTGDYFRVYDHELQSFNDRVQFLLRNKRYASAGVFRAKTPDQQATCLQLAGYATDPEYAAKVISIVVKYGLEELDT